MKRVKIYFQETRPQFLVLSIILVVLGWSVSVLLNSHTSLFNMLLALVGLILLHISVNVLNDYFDYKTGIDLNTERTPFNGGSGILTSGLMKPVEALIFGVVSFLLAIPIGLYFLDIVGLKILPIFILGAIFVLLYTPILTRIGYGVSEISAGLGLGTLPVYATYLVITGKYELIPLLYSIPSGFLVSALLLLNEIPDKEADKLGGRETLPIQIGEKKAFSVYILLVGSAYAWILGCVIAGVFPPLVLISLLTIPLFIANLKEGEKSIDTPQFAKIQGRNIPIVLFTQLLLAIGIFLHYLIMR